MTCAEGAWCDTRCLVSFAAIHEHSNSLPLSRINGVIAHAAARVRADAAFVLGVGCMAAFWGPKQVDTVRCTLQSLKVIWDHLEESDRYMQQPGRRWPQTFLCAKEAQNLGDVVIQLTSSGWSVAICQLW